MGYGSVTAAVADAGPLIHLSEVGCLSLLTLFEELHIPGAVRAETLGRGRIRIPDTGNVCWHSVDEVQVERFIQEHDLATLQAGERECLYLCRQIDIPVLLTDDLAVREAAKCLQLTPVGSLGVVVRAFRDELLSRSEAESYIVALYETSSLFVTRAIVELAIEQLGNY